MCNEFMIKLCMYKHTYMNIYAYTHIYIIIVKKRKDESYFPRTTGNSRGEMSALEIAALDQLFCRTRVTPGNWIWSVQGAR